MKINKPKALDNSWLGNTATIATLYKNGKVIGYCLDCPNPVAHCVARFGADKVIGLQGEYKLEKMQDRISAFGWLPFEKTYFKKAKQVPGY